MFFGLNQKWRSMTVYEALMLAIAFAMLVLSIVDDKKDEK